MSKLSEITSSIGALDGLSLATVLFERRTFGAIDHLAMSVHGPDKKDIAVELFSKTRRNVKELENVTIFCGIAPGTTDLAKMQEVQKQCLDIWGEPSGLYQGFDRHSYRVWKYGDDIAWNIYPFRVRYREEIAKIIWQAEVQNLVEDSPEAPFGGEHEVSCVRNINIHIYPDTVLAKAIADNLRLMSGFNIEESWLAKTKYMNESDRTNFYNVVVEKANRRYNQSIDRQLRENGS